jgi:transposase
VSVFGRLQEGSFDALGEDRCAKITLVSADRATWIAGVVKTRCRNATLCMDPFHAVKWCTDALDEVRARCGTRPARPA